MIVLIIFSILLILTLSFTIYYAVQSAKSQRVFPPSVNTCPDLWAVSKDGKGPGELISTISPDFNKAVLFDTTQDSWHGLPEPIKCPENVTRNSLAVYYLCYPRDGVDTRGKALFSPYKDQVNNQEVLDLIQKRSSVGMAANVYGDKKN